MYLPVLPASICNCKRQRDKSCLSLQGKSTKRMRVTVSCLLPLQKDQSSISSAYLSMRTTVQEKVCNAVLFDNGSLPHPIQCVFSRVPSLTISRMTFFNTDGRYQDIQTLWDSGLRVKNFSVTSLTLSRLLSMTVVSS